MVPEPEENFNLAPSFRYEILNLSPPVQCRTIKKEKICCDYTTGQGLRAVAGVL